MLSKIYLPDVTYIGAFLTLRCNFKCPYCLNRHGRFRPRAELTGAQWIEGLNRLSIERARMVPITLQGGEPSVHPDWIDLILGLDDDLYIDLLTNLTFDVAEFAKRIPPSRLMRNVPYASIRVSYHPNQKLSYNELMDKCSFLQDKGFSIGIFVVDHPMFDGQIPHWRRLAEKRGLDFRLKEFLGVYAGKVYGRFKYPNAVKGKANKIVNCRSTELLIAPDGHIHRCHRDLYAGESQIGHILGGVDEEFKFRSCVEYGECNECDCKLKNNRFQEMGACSVEIEDYYAR